jgi:Conserved TM helix
MNEFTTLLAQTQPAFLRDLGLAPFIVDTVLAIAILVIGWIVALIAASLTENLLKKTDFDNRLANWITGDSETSQKIDVEKWCGNLVFWGIMVLVLVAFLEKLKLTVVSQPINNFLNQILGFLPKIGGGIILLAIAWVLASLSKLILLRTFRVFRLDERLGQQVNTGTETTQLPLSETIANSVYWFIFLLFLPSVLSTLELQGTLQPVQELVNKILSILPNIFAAILIAATGWLVAQIVRRIVTNLLAATGADNFGSKIGISQATGGQNLSNLAGTLVYVFILIPTAIAGLNALKIDAISQPAITMLTQILDAVPKIFTASLILVISYYLGKIVADFISNILTSLGFNNVFSWLGIPAKKLSLPPANEDDKKTVLQTTQIPDRTASEIAGIIVLVGIMLLATVAATDVLKITSLTVIVTGIARICARILGGLVVFAIGLYLANLAYNLIVSTTARQAQILAHAARISIIILVSAMALQQMGIAHDIVNLAFGLLMGAIAVAIALAFGLGSRDIAAEQLREWLSSFKDNK